MGACCNGSKFEVGDEYEELAKSIRVEVVQLKVNEVVVCTVESIFSGICLDPPESLTSDSSFIDI